MKYHNQGWHLGNDGVMGPTPIGKTAIQQCRGMIALCQRRIANTDSREDCRELARQELFFWRRKLIQQLNN